MSRALTVMPAAVLALAVLAGCGAEATPSAAPATADAGAAKASTTADPHAKRRQMEAMRADCMKQKGFKYIPNVPSKQKVSEGIRKEASGDYAAMREYRQKHGFGVFFTSVYPDDPKEVQNQSVPNPNMEQLWPTLSKTQREAWTAADNACFAGVYKQLTGKTVSSVDDVFTQLEDMAAKARSRRLDGDPRIAELARGFGDCLKSKGYPVASLKPTALASNGRDIFEKELTEAMDQRKGSDKKLTFEAMQIPLSEARQHLTREIKASLDDLECGKDFYATVRPLDNKIEQEATDEFGGMDGFLPN